MQISLVFSFLWEPADVILPGFRFLWTFICRFTYLFVSLYPINQNKMKQVYMIAMLVICALTGCKSDKKQAEEEAKRIFQIETVDENTGLQRMQVSRISQEFTCKGKKFRLSVERTPSDDLPRVKSEMGLFADNRIAVKLENEGGKVFFNKVFTKSDFAAHLSEKYLSRSVLEGLVFDDVRTAERNEITLAASVSYPMTDLYVPFILTVSQDGKLSIALNEDIGEMTILEEDKE